MQFIDNGAGVKGACIFAATTQPCLWREEHPFFSQKMVFRWSDRFYYYGNYIGRNSKSRERIIGEEVDIATDVVKYTLNNQYQVSVSGYSILIDRCWVMCGGCLLFDILSKW